MGAEWLALLLVQHIGGKTIARFLGRKGLAGFGRVARERRHKRRQNATLARLAEMQKNAGKPGA